MKYITFAVPCFNSQDYMERCIDTLITGGEDVEVIIVDDGSTDNTGRIADEYEQEYSDIVRAVHKANGGHGSGVNKGLELARGQYFKVVDSDDWFDIEAYKQLLDRIRSFVTVDMTEGISCIPDMFVCNYVYDHPGEGGQKEVNFRNVFPEGRICTWNEIRHFHPSQYLIMHALIYRTELLKACGVRLPEHMFFVDNIFAYKPLPKVESIYYMDIDLYHYFLGREDQSVNEAMLMKRIDQQIFVTKYVSGCVDLNEVEKVSHKLAVYMRRNISIMMAISCIHLLLIHTPEAYRKRKELWESIRCRDRKLYNCLKFRYISAFTDLPGRLGDQLTIGGYRLAKKLYSFQ